MNGRKYPQLSMDETVVGVYKNVENEPIFMLYILHCCIYWLTALNKPLNLCCGVSGGPPVVNSEIPPRSADGLSNIHDSHFFNLTSCVVIGFLSGISEYLAMQVKV